jgi:hypothetical protein
MIEAGPANPRTIADLERDEPRSVALLRSADPTCGHAASRASTDMLALTDSQLAIAATAVERYWRRRWLKDLADRIDPPPRRLAIARARKARQPSQPSAPTHFPEAHYTRVGGPVCP